jgi:HD-GYP domain-containing protein (c-di-GMP phosphodiesterase class II)
MLKCKKIINTKGSNKMGFCLFCFCKTISDNNRLRKVRNLLRAIKGYHQHHERIDGSGYPRGLKEEEILVQAKIIAVADVVEAMASHRPYLASCGIVKAIVEINLNRGILYDGEVVAACIKVFEGKSPYTIYPKTKPF